VKKVFQKILSFGLATIVLLSTFSFSVSKHYCLNRLVDTSFITEAESCIPDIKASESCKSFKAVKSCCDNEHILVEGLDNFHFEKYVQLEFDVEYSYTPQRFDFKEIILVAKSKTLYFSYKPPPFYKSIYQLNESYLI
jgi:hypothetical protein